MIKDVKITIAKEEELLEILEIKKEVHKNFVKQRPDIYKESDILYTNDFINSFFANASKLILIAKKDEHCPQYENAHFITSSQLNKRSLFKRFLYESFYWL